MWRGASYLSPNRHLFGNRLSRQHAIHHTLHINVPCICIFFCIRFCNSVYSKWNNRVLDHHIIIFRYKKNIMNGSLKVIISINIFTYLVKMILYCAIIEHLIVLFVCLFFSFVHNHVTQGHIPIDNIAPCADDFYEALWPMFSCDGFGFVLSCCDLFLMGFTHVLRVNVAAILHSSEHIFFFHSSSWNYYLRFPLLWCRQFKGLRPVLEVFVTMHKSAGETGSQMTYCSHKPECIVTTSPDRSVVIAILTWHFQFRSINFFILSTGCNVAFDTNDCSNFQ